MPTKLPARSAAAAHPIAVIDIGASAIRMEIAEIGPGARRAPLESVKRAAALGKDSFSKGRLDRRTINLAIEVLRGFQEILRLYGVEDVRAVATSAVREAANQETFVERVYMATGLSVEVISGAEEDRLLYAAVRDAFRSEGLTEHENALIVEQGAGHMDIALLESGEVVRASSFSLGTLRLAAAVATERRSGSAAFDLMKRFVGASLDEIDHSFPLRRLENLILLGGDARFAADRLLPPRADAPRVRRVRRDAFLRLARAIAVLRPEEVAARHGLPFEECESLPPGLLTYAELLKRTPAKEVLIPSVSLRDGLLLDFAAEQTGQPLTDLDAQIYASAENLGRRYQFDEPHAHHVAELASTLFDALADEHRLGRRERRLLRVAALVHDIGLFVSPTSHHKHSEYLIGASDVFGVRAADKAIVACVARYHRRALPQASHPGFASLSRQDRSVVAKLAAILRVADALDRSHTQRVRLGAVAVGSDELVLAPEGDPDLALERLALRAKADLFEEVFGRKVVLQRSVP